MSKVQLYENVSGDSSKVVKVKDDSLMVIDSASRRIKRAADSFSRPADTTPYTAKDIVSDGTVRKLQLGTENGQGGVITKLRLNCNDKNVTARFRVNFFHTPPASATDNNPYGLLWSNRDKRLASLDFDAFTTEDPAGSDCASSSLVNQAFSYQLADQNLYYVLETLDAFTPVSACQFYFEIETTIPA